MLPTPVTKGPDRPERPRGETSREPARPVSPANFHDLVMAVARYRLLDARCGALQIHDFDDSDPARDSYFVRHFRGDMIENQTGSQEIQRLQGYLRRGDCN